MDKYQQAIVKAYDLKKQLQRLSPAIGDALDGCISKVFVDDESYEETCLQRAYRDIRFDFKNESEHVAKSCCEQCQRAHALIQERKKLRLSLGAAKGHLTKLGKALARGKDD